MLQNIISYLVLVILQLLTIVKPLLPVIQDNKMFTLMCVFQFRLASFQHPKKIWKTKIDT